VSGFFEELQRRKVYRVAAAYEVVGARHDLKAANFLGGTICLNIFVAVETRYTKIVSRVKAHQRRRDLIRMSHRYFADKLNPSRMQHQ
jgi:hypothetical protein